MKQRGSSDTHNFWLGKSNLTTLCNKPITRTALFIIHCMINKLKEEKTNTTKTKNTNKKNQVQGI